MRKDTRWETGMDPTAFNSPTAEITTHEHIRCSTDCSTK